MGEEAQEGEALLIRRPKGTGGLIVGRKNGACSETSLTRTGSNGAHPDLCTKSIPDPFVVFAP